MKCNHRYGKYEWVDLDGYTYISFIIEENIADVMKCREDIIEKDDYCCKCGIKLDWNKQRGTHDKSRISK